MVIRMSLACKYCGLEIPLAAERLPQTWHVEVSAQFDQWLRDHEHCQDTDKLQKVDHNPFHLRYSG
mgnify:FL=1